MLRNLRNESFHAISANAAMSKASADGKLPEPYRNVVGAWNEIQGFNYEIGSSVQEAFPFGSAGSPKFEEVEKSLLASLPPGRFRSMQEYFVDAYGSQMVKTAKAALEGKTPEPVSDLLRRFVAPNLSPQDGARFDAFMNDLLDKTKTAIREYERENPGVGYERMPEPIIDKVWEAIGGNRK